MAETEFKKMYWLHVFQISILSFIGAMINQFLMDTFGQHYSPAIPLHVLMYFVLVGSMLVMVWSTIRLYKLHKNE